MEKELKKGDIHPVTGNVYWSKSNKNASGEQWYTPSAFEKRIKKSKDFYNSEKGQKYHKAYYQNKKEDNQEHSRRSYEKKRKENFLTFLYYNAVNGVKRRSKILDMDITPDFVQELWVKQEGKCYYTGIPMQLVSSKKSPYQPSIDRRDSMKGYTKDNVVLCCQSINYAKSNYSEEDFREFLEALKLLP